MKSKIFTEKYRPEKLSGMVGKEKEILQNHIKDPEQMQHLLFYSVTAGTGKTTAAKAIINELGTDSLILNSSNDRKIEVIREKINEFVKTKSSVDGKRRIVFLDEADGMTKISQDALRNLMETYASNSIFILTCNNIKNIIDPIKSRCGLIEFKNPDRTELKNYLIMICKNENIEYTDEGLDDLIEQNYPSIRDCVKVLQNFHVQGKKITKKDNKDSNTEFNMLYKKITENKDWEKVKDYLFENYIDIRQLNKYFWMQATKTSNIKMIQITASNEEKMSRGGEDVVIFVSSLLNMIK